MQKHAMEVRASTNSETPQLESCTNTAPERSNNACLPVVKQPIARLCVLRHEDRRPLYVVIHMTNIMQCTVRCFLITFIMSFSKSGRRTTATLSPYAYLRRIRTPYNVSRRTLTLAIGLAPVSSLQPASAFLPIPLGARRKIPPAAETSYAYPERGRIAVHPEKTDRTILCGEIGRLL